MLIAITRCKIINKTENYIKAAYRVEELNEPFYPAQNQACYPSQSISDPGQSQSEVVISDYSRKLLQSQAIFLIENLQF